MKTNVLVGKTILAMYVAEDKAALRFDVDGVEQPIVVHCDAYCCSSTWVENIENPEAAVGSPVLEAIDIDMPEREHPEDKERDVVAYYGFRIRTAKGDCVLDYRNESNGYYGGNLSWPDDKYFYGGVYKQNVSKEEWKRVA
jgi:hypothetical protein